MHKENIIRWGITANSHDASLAVFNNNDLLFAAHSERSSHVKNDKFLNETLIDQAVEYGLPDEVHWYENHWIKRLRQIKSKQYNLAIHKETPATTLRKLGISTKFYNHKHHRSHAAAGFYTSPFNKATILVIDSIGEFETLTLWEGNGNELTKKYSQKYPHSIGIWYSAMTQRIGLKPNEDEYILMGWAAVGDPSKYAEKIYEDFFHPLKPGSMKVQLKQNVHRGCKEWAPELNTIQDYADIAAATQQVYERVFTHLCHSSKMKIKNSDNLVIMGGCALNCVANRWAGVYYKNIWIMPNPGDAGSSVGCVLDHLKTHIGFKTPYLGYNIAGDYPVKKAYKELLKTGMVGIANGRSEFGPRALGNRSLLADPRGKDVKDLVNSVKRRQDFRPFAPVIMEEYVHEYFEMPPNVNTSPYMQVTARTKHPELFPAITHVDGTARVQTVTEEQNPGLYKLLEMWYKKTKCPMLLNTSLNIKGSPIVDTEHDAATWGETYKIKVFTKEN